MTADCRFCGRPVTQAMRLTRAFDFSVCDDPQCGLAEVDEAIAFRVEVEAARALHPSSRVRS